LWHGRTRATERSIAGAVIGSTLGSYTIQRELGRGGMGAVFVGVHALLGRQAAIKVLLPELSRHRDIVQRFFNEARAATAIKHPGIVEVYDFGTAADGSAYIVMELLAGESLASRLQRGRLAPAQALLVARQVAAALGAAHRAGIVHRDLKPDNIYLEPDEESALGARVKLLDFGIAKLSDAGALTRTSAGAVMGTPYYMAPEQCRGAPDLDHRADLYALGCVLYEMLCGRPPFVADVPTAVLSAHLVTAPVPPRSLAPDVPPELEAIALWLLAKAPDHRPASADALIAELTAVGQRLGIAGPSAVMSAVHPSALHGALATPSPTTLGGVVAARTTNLAAARRWRGAVLGGAVVAIAALVVVAVVVSSEEAAPVVVAAAPVLPAVEAAAPVLPAVDAGVPDAAPAKPAPAPKPKPLTRDARQRAKIARMLNPRTGIPECDRYLRVWAKYLLCDRVSDADRARLDVDAVMAGWKSMNGYPPGSEVYQNAINACAINEKTYRDAAPKIGCNVD
jgi:tRNA A-37 threonylcarbamoyl transferase component Bud32